MNEPAQTLPAHALEQGFQIGELLIDPQDGQVSGRSGLQKLDPKVMDVLVMLAPTISADQPVPRSLMKSRIIGIAVVS
jgi:hypothetical protein